MAIIIHLRGMLEKVTFTKNWFTTEIYESNWCNFTFAVFSGHIYVTSAGKIRKRDADIHTENSIMGIIENMRKAFVALALLSAVAAFLLLAGLAAMVIRDKVVPLFAGFILDIHMLMFCTYIGLLALSLLGLDYIIRRHLSRKHASAGPDGR